MSIGINLERFAHFRDAEFRSLEVLSPTEISAVFALQDKARAFDWITLTLEFSGVSDARLVDAKKIAYIDMSEGVSFIETDGNIAFAVGQYETLNNTRNATCYVIADSLNTFEDSF